MALRFVDEKKGIARFKEQIQDNSLTALIIVLMVVLVIIGVCAFVFSYQLAQTSHDTLEINELKSEAVEDKLSQTTESAAPLENELSETELVIVHVDGAVNNPGVFQLNSNNRIQDAVSAAGGLTDSAQIKAINLASKLSDGSKIYIPSKEESQSVQVELAFDGMSVAQKLNNQLGKININQASAEELSAIPGVGPKTAQAIIDERKNGAYTSIEDICRVSGIGEKKFNKMKEYICV